ADLPLLASGKVREIYDLGDELLIVASDRISTYDVVHPTPIPDKGNVLTGLSTFWFDRTTSIVPNHVVSVTDGVPAAARGRAMGRSGDRTLAERIRDVSLALYEHAAEHARQNGIILADTKFELGLDGDGTLTIGDEICTPDSSRFWPADQYEPGRGQPSFDKQYVRDWASSTGWDRNPPAPAIPEDVVARTREKYVEAYERITG